MGLCNLYNSCSNTFVAMVYLAAKDTEFGLSEFRLTLIKYKYEKTND